MPSYRIAPGDRRIPSAGRIRLMRPQRWRTGHDISGLMTNQESTEAAEQASTSSITQELLEELAQLDAEMRDSRRNHQPQVCERPWISISWPNAAKHDRKKPVKRRAELQALHELPDGQIDTIGMVRSFSTGQVPAAASSTDRHQTADHPPPARRALPKRRRPDDGLGVCARLSNGTRTNSAGPGCFKARVCLCPPSSKISVMEPALSSFWSGFPASRRGQSKPFLTTKRRR